MTRIAIIGLGQRLGQVLPQVLKRGQGYEIVGFADPQPGGLPALEAAGYGAGRAFDSPAALLAATKPDLVMIGSPNHLHLDHIALALDAAPLVFTEKPVVRTEEESYAVAELARGETGRRILVGLVLRSAPLVKRVRAIIDSGRLGRIVSIEANENLNPEHGAFLMKDWRRHKAFGGSFLLDKCCHDFDLYGWFAGARAARIASFGGRQIFTPENEALAARTYPDGRAAYQGWPGRWNAGQAVFRSDADVRDVQTALVEYANGVQLSFHANSCAGFHQRRWHIVGTKASMAVDVYKGRLVIGDPIGRGRAEKIDMSAEAGYDAHTSGDPALAADIVRTVSEGAPFPVTVGEALEAGLTVMGADRAVDEGRIVDMAPVWSRLDAASGGPHQG